MKKISLARENISPRRLVLTVLGTVACLAFFWWFFFMRGLEKTDNAYLKTNITVLSPKITGYVAKVLVEDNQKVAEGDVVVIIDSRDFEAKVSQADASLLVADAELERIEKDLKRTENLVAKGNASEQSLDSIRAEYKIALGQVQTAKADLELAKIDLENTIIKAPRSGYIGNKGVREGQLVKAGTALASLVPDNEIWVEANFKETQIEDIKEGQKVKIEVDAYPSDDFEGIVESLAPASGSEFSILPPENATGNFTKIVRRIPVRIKFKQGEDVSKLKAGMSVFTTVFVK
ncbi:MAG: HlyD family secretion protein [Alphaproteobacteria bacterium]